VNEATKTLAGPVALLLVLGGLFVGLRAAGSDGAPDGAVPADTLGDVHLVESTDVTPATDGVAGDAPAEASESAAQATFAGGCFWCMEPPFDELEGVQSTVSGFAGGEVVDPSYEQVASGRTDHREVVQVTYDPRRISYTRLLEVYWHNVDPVDGDGQFCDRGHQYSPAIFAHNDEQEALARASLERLAAALVGSDATGDGEAASGAGNRAAAAGGSGPGARVAVDIEPLEAFYRAEDYHQDFYQKNPDRYYSYREGCARDDRLREVWGDAAGR
jgi:peptide-methionine (S)-S-oxide reductase